MPIGNIVNELTSMRNKMIYHSMFGEYKDYVAARKNFAKYCVQYPQETLQMPRFKGQFSIFSKYGRNIIKTCIKEIFRTKTPEEKEMMKIAERYKAQQKLNRLG